MSRVVVNEIEAKVGNDISFNDTVKIDTIKGKTTAGSVTVQGEGSATTNLQQGLAKTWVNFNGNSTIATRDSLNNASLTDNGTGDYTVNFTNNMGNDDYAVSWNSGLKSITWGLPIFIGLSGAGNNDCFSTSKFRVGSTQPDDNLVDNFMCNAITLGDLA
tara:strand:- start:97 stop:576 length:480 start_codon:yes stop_codon:yes gene_type:complete